MQQTVFLSKQTGALNKYFKISCDSNNFVDEKFQGSLYPVGSEVVNQSLGNKISIFLTQVVTNALSNEGSTSTAITVTDVVHKDTDEKLLSESDITTTGEENLSDIVGKNINNDNNVNSGPFTPNNQEQT